MDELTQEQINAIYKCIDILEEHGLSDKVFIGTPIPPRKP